MTELTLSSFGALGSGLSAAAAPVQPESTAPLAPPAPPAAPAPTVLAEVGSPVVPFHGARFEFGSAASVTLGMLRIRGDEREALRRAVEIDAKLERALSRKPPSPRAVMMRAVRKIGRGR